MSEAWYREWDAHPELRPFVVCAWASRSGDRAPGRTDHILPDGCTDIIWNGADLFVAGPDTGPVPRPWVAGSFFAGIRFRPGAGAAALGLPASELRDQRVPVADLWRREVVTPNVDRLAAARSPSAGAAELERSVRDQCRLAPRPDALVQAAITAIVRGPHPEVGRLHRHFGVTDRTLRRRVTDAVGYGPKRLARVVRFRRFLAAAHDHPAAGLARLAAGVGYADQAHLSRECRQLAGVTPTELLRTRDVRSVQDGLVTEAPYCERTTA